MSDKCPISVALISGFCSMKRQGVFLPPPHVDGMLVHRRVTPSIKFASTHLIYTWVERGTVRVVILFKSSALLKNIHVTYCPQSGFKTRTFQSKGKRIRHLKYTACYIPR